MEKDRRMARGKRRQRETGGREKVSRRKGVRMSVGEGKDGEVDGNGGGRDGKVEKTGEPRGWLEAESSARDSMKKKTSVEVGTQNQNFEGGRQRR